MLSPGLATAMNKVPFCETEQTSSLQFVPETLKINCGIAAGYLAVYRLCFAMTLFFLFMVFSLYCLSHKYLRYLFNIHAFVL